MGTKINIKLSKIVMEESRTLSRVALERELKKCLVAKNHLDRAIKSYYSRVDVGKYAPSIFIDHNSIIPKVIEVFVPKRTAYVIYNRLRKIFDKFPEAYPYHFYFSDRYASRLDSYELVHFQEYVTGIQKFLSSLTDNLYKLLSLHEA